MTLSPPILTRLTPEAIESFLGLFEVYEKQGGTVSLSNCLPRQILEPINLLKKDTRTTILTKEEDEEDSAFTGRKSAQENQTTKAILAFLRAKIEFQHFNDAEAAFGRTIMKTGEEDPLERVMAYAYAFSKVAAKCENLEFVTSEAKERYLLEKFANGVRPQALRNSLQGMLRSGMIESLEDAIEEVEAELKVIRKMERYTRSIDAQNEVTNQLKWKDDVKTCSHFASCFLLNAPSQSTPSSSQISHKSCKYFRPNSFIKVDHPPSSSCSINVSNRSHPGLTTSSGSTPSQNLSTGNLLSIPILINGQSLSGIIETGAEVSTITPDLVDLFNLTVNPTSHNVPTADQSTAFALGTISVKLSLKLAPPAQQVTLNSCLFVLKGTNQVLIGADVLRLLGIMTDSTIHLNVL
ncbi:hypothetical protein RCL1_004558 [Eukaryota sp. TZLM3-RCL]